MPDLDDVPLNRNVETAAANVPWTSRDVGGYAFAYYPIWPTTGITSASLSVDLAKNTVIRRFDVVVKAARAEKTAAEKLGQVRSYSGSGANTVVIDFGVPRTVSAISVEPAAGATTITSVSAWTGAAFADPFYPDGKSRDAVFKSEVRSERLLINLSNAISKNLIGQHLILELPEVPADLEIRINGGAPVWTSPGPVQPAAETNLNTNAWNKDAMRIVSLKDALNALLADPLSREVATYEIKLTAKVPGVLTIDRAVDDAHRPSFSYVERILFDDDTSKVVDFTEEGYVDLPLPLKHTGGVEPEIEEIRLTAIGNLPPERILPAVGPPWASTADAPILAELVLDAERAACVRLSANSGIAELTGIRLPLATDGDGAEVTVVLWENEQGHPLKPMIHGASKPVTLNAAPAASDLWTRFEFAKPVAIDTANPPWAAVLVSRGTVTWALAATSVVTIPATPDDQLVQGNELRRGAPSGPWHALPQPFLSETALMHALGRVRMIGNSDKTTPVAPLIISALGTSKEIIPTVKGVPVVIARNDALAAARYRAVPPGLLIVSRTTGAVTLRDVDVTWRES